MEYRYVFLLLVFLCTGTPHARGQETFYVASDASILGTGTLENPFFSMEVALNAAEAGDTIFVRGGTYYPQGSVRIEASGREDARLHIWAYPGELPVFDFTGANRGFDVRGNYLHLKGLVAEKAQDNGIYVKRASHNILELLVARYNGDSGIQMEDSSSYNLFLNLDSYHNYDQANNGENADGFAIKFGVGPGNVIKGCRAWGNADDGFDFWSRDDPGQNGVHVEGNWSFRNGINIWNVPDFQGDSNGFKLGHGPGDHTLIGNLAWGHIAHGFDVNGNTSGVVLYNNTGFDNAGRNFYFDFDQNVEQGYSLLRNNLSLGDIVMSPNAADHLFNSWNNGMPSVSVNDFMSIEDEGATGPRGEGGSLPYLEFLRLSPSSQLIDAGVDVGTQFNGGAPDLGAFESVNEASTQTENSEIDQSHYPYLLAYPNPFQTTTKLEIQLDNHTSVRIEIWDMLGRHIDSIFDGELAPGSHRFTWDADPVLAAGVYFVRMVNERQSIVHPVYLK